MHTLSGETIDLSRSCVSVFLCPNGPTKPKMSRNRLSAQAHLQHTLFVSSLWQQFPFPGHFPQETGKTLLHVCLHVQAEQKVHHGSVAALDFEKLFK